CLPGGELPDELPPCEELVNGPFCVYPALPPVVVQQHEAAGHDVLPALLEGSDGWSGTVQIDVQPRDLVRRGVRRKRVRNEAGTYTYGVGTTLQIVRNLVWRQRRVVADREDFRRQQSAAGHCPKLIIEL